MLIVNPDGLFRGDRLAMCSKTAWLYWTPIFLCANGFGRFEVNHARIAQQIGPHAPTEAEFEACIREYARVRLLFPYRVGVKRWGQWDADKRFLPRWKTAQDRQSPEPPEPDYTNWLREYHGDESKSLPKISEDFGGFLESSECNSRSSWVVDVDVKNTCASPHGNARVRVKNGLTPPQEGWFNEWWDAYWLHKAKKAAREAFRKQVQTESRFRHVMTATKAQAPEMLTREPNKRPHASTWLNGERWDDETVGLARKSTTETVSPYRRWEPPKRVDESENDETAEN